jgi:Ca2+-binding EF-hand superfamily protein
VNLEEFRGKKSAEEATDAFKKLDKDGDGSLTLEEFSAPGKRGEKKEKKQ